MLRYTVISKFLLRNKTVNLPECKIISVSKPHGIDIFDFEQ